MPEAIINGVKHHWEDLGEGEPLVTLHGASQSGLTQMRHAEALSKTHRVIVPDMRGMGQSAHVTELPPSAWVDDVVGLLDHLGLEQAHLHGRSLGARVALRFAIDHRERVRGLMLELPIIAMQLDTNAVLNNILDVLESAPQAEQDHRFAMHGADWKAVTANYMTIRNRPELQAHYDLRELSKTVRAPTLIFRTDEREVMHPIGHCLELHENIPGSWLWIAPHGIDSVLNFAPQDGYARMRELMAIA